MVVPLSLSGVFSRQGHICLSLFENHCGYRFSKSFVSTVTEAPEEEYDPRSLYEKLEEQKQRKQEEFESQFKFGQYILTSLLLHSYFRMFPYFVHS